MSSINKPLKDILLEKTAEELGQPIPIVEAVVKWGMKDLNKAFKEHQLVELSGFGQFYLSQVKLKRRIERCERIMGYLLARNPPSEKDKEKIETTEKYLAYYYSKLKTNENNEQIVLPNSGGVEEPSNTSPQIEGAN